jgi:O-antigen/teichoic acid export membrane protein
MEQGRGEISGTVWITAGYLAVAASSAVLLAAGPRILGSDDFSGLALVWTLSSLFGLGVATPTEQVVTRRVSARAADVRRPVQWLVVGALGASLLLAVLGDALPAARASSAMVPAAIGAIVGWTVVGPVRGLLAGAGQLRRYAVVLGVEAGLRILIVLVGALVSGASGTLLAGAVGAPLIVAGLVGRLLRATAKHVVVEQAAESRSLEHVYFGVVSLAYQACLNGPALILDGQRGTAEPALIGMFVAASTVLRAPSLLVSGLNTVALVNLSRRWSVRDVHGFAASTAQLAVRWVVFVVPASVVLLVMSPWLLPVYYGSPVHLPSGVVVSLTLSTIVATAGATGTAPLFASGRGHVAAGAWTVGAALTLVGLGWSGRSDGRLAASLVLGPALVMLVVVGASWRMTRR